MDNRSKLSIKLDACQRFLMVNSLSTILPLYIVTEHPKSGGSWVAQMLAEYLEIPFPRNQRPSLQSSVMHGHMCYSPFMRNVLCVHRDGRDIMTSAYFHRLFENEKNSPLMVQKTRREVPFSDYDNVRKNMPSFIQYMANVGKHSLSPGKFNWNDFVTSWAGKKAVVTKYEDMLDSPESELGKVVTQLTGEKADEPRVAGIVEQFSFGKMANRNPGEEDTKSFLRKGQAGDWKDKFNREAAQVFNSHFGSSLISLGYEQDDSWVAEVLD